MGHELIVHSPYIGVCVGQASNPGPVYCDIQTTRNYAILNHLFFPTDHYGQGRDGYVFQTGGLGCGFYKIGGESSATSLSDLVPIRSMTSWGLVDHDLDVLPRRV